ncbi:MAG: rhomboid family intramembrane serine protease, partial [Lawsonibacter sp.]|nr:rhomboid family intramembrane serine protease [Lawsonibacter sp.]
LSSLAGMKEGAIPLTLILVVILYLGGEAVDAATVQDSVSHLTHIVGGLCGAGLGFGMSRR